MNNLIDKTYFVGDIWLPVDEIESEINTLIAREQKNILIKCLGFELYKELEGEISGDYVGGDEWDKLCNGTTWTDGLNYLREWVGFRNDEKESLIAYWVYYKYLVNSSTNVSAAGGKIMASENSVNIDTRAKQEYAYNKVIDLMNELDDFINQANMDVPDTYDNYEPTTLGRVNQFNI
jgi:hypothetical protein